MGEEIKYNAETVKTVLNILQKEYESEEGRSKHITSKIPMMLTMVTITLTAIIFLLKTVIEQNLYVNFSITLLFLAFLTIIIAIIFFLDVIRIKTFKRIKYESLVFDDELKKEPVEIQSRLIATYEEALKDNIPVGDRMTKYFQWGTYLTIVSIILVFAVLLVVFLFFYQKLIIGGNL